jgi:hypothetical protein
MKKTVIFALVLAIAAVSLLIGCTDKKGAEETSGTSTGGAVVSTDAVSETAEQTADPVSDSVVSDDTDAASAEDTVELSSEDLETLFDFGTGIELPIIPLP